MASQRSQSAKGGENAEISLLVESYMKEKGEKLTAMLATQRTNSQIELDRKKQLSSKENDTWLLQFDREESARTLEIENTLRKLESTYKQHEKVSEQHFKLFYDEMAEVQRQREIEIAGKEALAERQRAEAQRQLTLQQESQKAHERALEENFAKSLLEKDKLETQKAALFTPESAMKEMRTYSEKLNEIQSILLPYMKNALPHVKSQRMDIKLLINRRVQQISATIDQVASVGQELVGLLTQHRSQQDAFAYCIDTLALKLVEQGDSQVYVHQSSAYPIAIVIVYVAQKFPEFLDIIMAHFIRRCPYVVPRYFQRDVTMTERDHLLAMGFVEKDGGLEAEESYNERMTGIMSLYSAMLQTKNIPGHVNPRGIQYAWTWLARLLNMPPRRVTPSILVAFLQIAGHAMHATYGRQFYKMMKLTKATFLPKMPQGVAGSTSRLDVLVSKYLAEGTFPPHEGYMTW